MKCKNCGKIVNKEFNYCSYCGADLHQVSKMEAKVEENKKNMTETSDVQISLAGRTLMFSHEFIEYNKFRKIFFDRGEELEDEYIKFYKKSKITFESIFSEHFTIVFKQINRIVKLGISVLNQYGINNIYEDIVFTKINKEIESEFQYIICKMREILDLDEKSLDFREIFSQYNQYWVGGGLGVKGAIKGAIQADVLNVGTYLAQNAIGETIRAIDKMKIQTRLKEFANSEELFYNLHNIIYRSAVLVFHFVKGELVDRKLINDYPFNMNEFLENKNTINMYLENYDSQPYSDKLYNETVDALCKYLNKDPYQLDAYIGLYRILRTGHKDIEKLARCFGEGRGYKKGIIKCDLDRIEKVKTLEENTLQQINTKIKKIELIIRNNPSIEVTYYYDTLCRKRDKMLEEEDIKNREKLELERIDEECNDIQKKNNMFMKKLENGSLDFVWKEIKKDNYFAMYAVKVYYYNISKPQNGDQYGTNNRIAPLLEKSELGDKFATYLVCLYNYIALDNTPWRWQVSGHKEEKSDYYKKLKEFADEGNILAIGDVGYIQCTHFWNTELEGVQRMKKAAKQFEPFALLHLGEGYKEGRWNLKKRTDLAEKCIKYATAYGLDNDAANVKSDTSANEGGCFITSAVCKSFGKLDNCYELVSFRTFRDDWLTKQPNGNSLIEEYYQIAPTIVQNIDATSNSRQIYRNIWNNYLKKCLTLIECKKFEQCKQVYCEMVADLKKIYYNQRDGYFD